MALFTTEELFDLTHTAAAPLLKSTRHPHEALPLISEFTESLTKTLPPDRYLEIGEGVFAARSARIAKSAMIAGPTVIGEECEIRHAAFIRGAVIVGRGAVIGNSSEVKNAILFDGVQIPHYNYVGDSILGYMAHMGAGAIASNFRLDKKSVILRADGVALDTRMRKVGAFLGDYAEIGCQAVLFPGATVGRRSIVYPLTRVRGTVPADSICKDSGAVFAKEAR